MSWTITPPHITDTEEHGTASFVERVAAACRVQAAGYRVGFHFDPLIEYPDWEADYAETIAQLFSAIDPRRVAWLSLGSLRLTPALASSRAATLSWHPPLVRRTGSMCQDGKWRTFQPLRVKMYRTLSSLAETSRADGPAIYVYGNCSGVGKSFWPGSKL